MSDASFITQFFYSRFTDHNSLHCGGQPRNQRVDQLQVGVGVRQRPRILREIRHFRARRTGDFLRDFSIVKRFDDDCLDLLRFHLLDHFREVGRRGRNAWLGLEKNIDVQAETVREVNPRIVVSHDALPLKRQQGRAPFLELGVDRCLELLVVRVIGRGVWRIHRGERLGDVQRDRLGYDRVDHEMGISSACTSPAARVAFAGTFINRTPWDACTRPGLPTSNFGLRAFCKSGGNQPSSSSAPPSMSTSALRSCTTKLGRASTKCESSVGFAIELTSTLSPPISRASDARSGRVATTLMVACAEKASAMEKAAVNNVRFIEFSGSEFMGAMRTENEFKLKED